MRPPPSGRTLVGQKKGNRHMRNILLRLSAFSTSVVVAVALLTGMYQPALVLADTGTAPATTTPTPDPSPAPTPTPAPTATPAPAPATTSPTPTPTPVPTKGPNKPTGASANTYTYNSATGMWESQHYIWDPITGQTTPKDPVAYSYNPTTGMWDTTQYIFNAATNKYEPNIISVISPPLGAALVSNPTLLGGNLLLPNPGDQASSIKNSGYSSSIFNSFYNATISNNIDSTATSGDATVKNNTTAGNAITGSTQAIANVLNLMNSSWGIAASNPIMFVANILGNVIGDMFLDPGSLGQQSSSVNNNQNNNVQVNSASNGLINNNIDLNANSGNANVSGNTKAGNATSGDSIAMANVVNLMNTSIGAGQSFIGMINILGNLNGDILLPQGTLNSLLASNNQPTVQLTLPQNSTTNNTVALTDNQIINNQLSANAQSGQASVANNTTAGNATTGNATTSITLLNLTGRQVTGKDALLVFVNVLGSWVGMIVNAPVGSTASALGGGVSQNNFVPTYGVNNSTVNATNNSAINNNISANATTGNATVTNNTNAGNATTGNASASINLLNVTNSSFSLSDWFGVLFINVFGNWHGSFGVNTDAGNPINTPSVASQGNIQAFAFVPSTIGDNGGSAGSTLGIQNVTDSQDGPVNQVLGSTTTGSSGPGPATVLASANQNQQWRWVVILGLFASTVLAGFELQRMRQEQDMAAAIASPEHHFS